MINDAIYWLSSLSLEQYLLSFSGLILLDGPRYFISNMVMMFWSFFSGLFPKKRKQSYFPSVSVVIPCLNEEATIYQCLESLYGSYPYLQLIVIDDGSKDKTFELSQKFAMNHNDVIVLRRTRGGGKSSAQNFAFPYITGEIVVVVDSDSTYGDNAIYHLVQPFSDPKIGGTSGNILVRNTNDSLCSLFQSYEYLVSILVGRILSSKLGMLSIISGAFGAIRKEIFLKGYGMDVGPSEDSDITLRIRKMGYNVVFVPEAECFTDVPTTWKSLWFQRLRWDMGIVRIHLRKHFDSYNLFNNNFRLTNTLYWYDTMLFSVWCTLSFWVFLIFTFASLEWDTLQNVIIASFFAYMIMGIFQTLTVIFYSQNIKRDISSCIVFPIYSLYGGLFMRAVRTVAILDEFFNRSSYRDSYVPKFVQEKAFNWKSKY